MDELKALLPQHYKSALYYAAGAVAEFDLDDNLRVSITYDATLPAKWTVDVMYEDGLTSISECRMGVTLKDAMREALWEVAMDLDEARHSIAKSAAVIEATAKAVGESP
jgi:hypothetical protein